MKTVTTVNVPSSKIEHTTEDQAPSPLLEQREHVFAGRATKTIKYKNAFS